MSKRILLSDEIARRRENSIIIEIEGQEPIMIDQPDLWPDEKITAMESAKETDNMQELGHILLGDDYERFVQAGGTSMMAWSIFKEHIGAMGESSGS